MKARTAIKNAYERLVYEARLGLVTAPSASKKAILGRRAIVAVMTLFTAACIVTAVAFLFIGGLLVPINSVAMLLLSISFAVSTRSIIAYYAGHERMVQMQFELEQAQLALEKSSLRLDESLARLNNINDQLDELNAVTSAANTEVKAGL
jgi:uncharacterized membrane protein (DUF106 family)